MGALSMVGMAMMVLALVAFVGIVWWAFGARRKKDFDEAAQAPFALPDEGGAENVDPARDGKQHSEKSINSKLNNGNVSHE